MNFRGSGYTPQGYGHLLQQQQQKQQQQQQQMWQTSDRCQVDPPLNQEAPWGKKSLF